MSRSQDEHHQGGGERLNGSHNSLSDSSNTCAHTARATGLLNRIPPTSISSPRFYETNREGLTPQSITPIDLRVYKRYLLENQGFKPAIVNRRLASISAFCKWAQEQGLADGNPCDETSIVPEVWAPPKWPTKKEQYALIRAVQKASRPGDEALIMPMLRTSLRCCHPPRSA